MSLRKGLTNLGIYLLLGLAALIVLFPVLWALAASLMTQAELASWPPRLPSRLNLSNYQHVLQTVPIGRHLLNSFLVSGLVTLGQIVTSALAAYALVFLRFRYKGVIFGAVMATMMVPWEVTIIPNYLTIRSLRLLDSYPGLVLPFLTSAFGIFLLRQFFLSLPRELEEAARIDGCSSFRFLWSVVLPLSRPGLITLGAYTFLSTWNQYLWPLLVTNDKMMRTVQIAIRFSMNEESLHYPTIMTLVILFMVPALLLLLWGYRYLVQGLLAGSVKG